MIHSSVVLLLPSKTIYIYIVVVAPTEKHTPKDFKEYLLGKYLLQSSVQCLQHYPVINIIASRVLLLAH